MDVVRVDLRGPGRAVNFGAWLVARHDQGYRVYLARDESHALALRSTRRTAHRPGQQQLFAEAGWVDSSRHPHVRSDR